MIHTTNTLSRFFMTLGKVDLGEIQKGGGEFFSEKLGGRRLFFRKNKGGQDFFSTKKGGDDFFSGKFSPKPGLGTRYILTGP